MDDWCSILLFLPCINPTCHFFGTGLNILDLEIETFQGILQPANLLCTGQCSGVLDERERGIELFQLLLLCNVTLPVVDGISGRKETFSFTPTQSEKINKTSKGLFRLVFLKNMTLLKCQSTGNPQHSFLFSVTQPLKEFNCEQKQGRERERYNPPDAWFVRRVQQAST